MNNAMPLLAEAILSYLSVASVTVAVLAPLAWGIIKTAGIRAPVHRQLLWLYCLIGIAIVPALWLYGPKLTLAVLPARVRPVEVASSPPVDSSLSVEHYLPKGNSEPILSQNTPPASAAAAEKKSLALKVRTVPAKVVLAVFWLAGFIFMMTRLTVGWYRLRKICLAATSVAQDERLRNVADRKVKLFVTSKVGSPACFGILQPSIILPQQIYDGSTAEELRMVLSHEIAHIERKDCWTNLFQRLVEAAFFFHPLVWLASSQLTRERERICDSYVISRGVSAVDYTALLSHIVQQGLEKRYLASVALFEGRLLQRVRFLLDPKRSNRTRLSLGATLACTAAVLVCFNAFSIIRLEARADADLTDQQGFTEGASAHLADPNELKEDFKNIAQLILQYRRLHGHFPNSLKELDQLLPKDVYSPTGEDYHYESNRKRFILSSCGQDGIYGNDDDEIFIAYNHRHGSRSGQRSEICPLDEEDVGSQTEMLGPSGRRPKGNCSISGKVVSEVTGRPVDHAKVYLFCVGTHDALFIDVAADGTFDFKDIPAGEHSLAVIHTAGFQESPYNPDNKPGRFPPFTLKEGQKLSDIVFELKPAFRISGKVLDENGNPLENTDGIHVLAWGQRTNDEGQPEYYNARQSTINRLDGSYSLYGLDGEPVYVMAIDWHAHEKDSPYPPRYWPGTFSRSEAKPITFDNGWEIENVDIRLQKSGGLVLQGTVTDESTGEPVPQAFVVVHHEDMCFDFATAYADERGRYRIEGLGEGDFLAHVDAVHRGFVRTREPVKIKAGASKTTLDFTLGRGVTISGRIVDEEGDDWPITSSHGWAFVKDYPGPNRSFSLTNFRNKHRPKDAGHGSGGTFKPGEGDYASGEMIFPTKSRFIFQGMMPGQTMITFAPKAEGLEVEEILCNGQDIMRTGIETQAGRDINDVTIIVGRE
ncbi:MAG: M56 family metallopeptidase [Planctomycetota bacterium]|jgi:beta-lactamase regulating signal transducer with metallopeptidase domain